MDMLFSNYIVLQNYILLQLHLQVLKGILANYKTENVLDFSLQKSFPISQVVCYIQRLLQIICRSFSTSPVSHTWLVLYWKLDM